jgi:GDP-L-fucose synthase
MGLQLDLNGRSIFVAGHRGMVGRALCRSLSAYDVDIVTANRENLDLMRQSDVSDWFSQNRPDVVFVAAGKAGGIGANISAPATFLFENLMIGANIIHAAHVTGVKKLVYIGSSSTYPRNTLQPMQERQLLTGPLEPTNEAYAVAKIACIKMCETYFRQHCRDFIAVQPTNLYGANDRFDSTSSHVVPALIANAHWAKLNRDKELVVWGSGTPRREFMHVDDFAEAILLVTERYSSAEPINIGSGDELSIRELAELVCEAVGLEAKLRFDQSKPDGIQRKLLNCEKLRRLGFFPRRTVANSLRSVYADALDRGAFERQAEIQTTHGELIQQSG